MLNSVAIVEKWNIFCDEIFNFSTKIVRNSVPCLSKVVRPWHRVCLEVSGVEFVCNFPAVYSRVLNISFASRFTLAVYLLRQSLTQFSITSATAVQDIIGAVDCFLFVKSYLFVYVVFSC